jgi:hypothetical protein
VRRYPGAWLAHRWETFRALLGLQGGPAFYPYHAAVDPNPWGFRVETGGAAYRALAAVREAARDGIAFRGWFWLALAAAAGVLGAARARRDPVPLSIALSGLAYALGYALVSVSAEFRYLCWTALSSSAAVLAALGAPSPDRRG